MRLGDPASDGKAEPIALAAVAGAAITGSEPLEHVREEVGGDTWSVVDHRDGDEAAEAEAPTSVLFDTEIPNLFF